MRNKSAKEVAAAFYDTIITRHSTPRALLSDRGTEFMSRIMSELCKILEVKRLHTSPFHPATNSSVERMNAIIAQSIRVYCSDAREIWPHLLPSIMAGYRLSPCINSTGFSPYFMLYGREPRLAIDNILQPISSEIPMTLQTDLRVLLDNLEIARTIARKNVQAAQETYKTNYDKKAKEPSFKVGQRVWLRKGNLMPHFSRKLQRKYEGPFYIVFAYVTPNYLLRHCGTHKPLRSPIHANRLKPYFGPESRPQEVELPSDPDLVEDGHQGVQLDEKLPNWVAEDDLPLSVLRDRWRAETKLDLVPPIHDLEKDEQVVRRIISTKRIGGIRHYLVRYHAEKTPRWVSSSLLPAMLTEDYHTRKTWRSKSKSAVDKLQGLAKQVKPNNEVDN